MTLKLDEVPQVVDPAAVTVDGVLDAFATRIAEKVVAKLNGSAAPEPQATDRLLTVDQVAGRLGVTPDYVYRHAKGWPFRRKVGKYLKFSERGLERWMERSR